MTESLFKYKCECISCGSDPQKMQSDIKQAISDYSKSHCEHPVRMRVLNSDDGKYHEIIVGCGKCKYCRDKMRDEWTTRLCHEFEVATHCYFVTLTYQSFVKFSNIPKFLLDAYWHYDSLNEKHRECYSPCLCRLEHFQYFIRNLRNDLRSSNRPDRIKYFAGFEIGPQYGRPHIHVILFTYGDNSQLYQSDIVKAWSFRSGKKYMHTFPIGHVDFQYPGTFKNLHNVKLDGKNISAKNAFKYVAKYVNKSDEINTSRIKFMYDDLLANYDCFWYYSRQIFNDRMFKKIFCGKDCQFMIDDINSHNHDYDIVKLYNGDYINIYKYDKLFKEFIFAFARDSFKNFCWLFRPFTVCSRRPGIGEVYAKSNLERMAAGNFSISSQVFGTLLLPRYYVRKVKEYLCGIKFHSKLEKSDSFSSQNRPYLLDSLRELTLHIGNDSISKDYVCDKNPFACDIIQLNELLRSKFSIVDVYTSKRYLIYTQDNYVTYSDGNVFHCPELMIGEFYYDRKLHRYVFIKEYFLDYFLDDFYYKWLDSKKLSDKVFNHCTDTILDLDTAIQYCDSILENNSFVEIYDLCKLRAVEQTIAFEKDNYNKYNKKLF